MIWVCKPSCLGEGRREAFCDCEWWGNDDFLGFLRRTFSTVKQYMDLLSKRIVGDIETY